MKKALALLVLIAAAVEGCNGDWMYPCSPGYDDTKHDVFACDGDVLRVHTEVCHDESNPRSVDCAAQGKVCVSSDPWTGACQTACTSDAVCGPDAFCPSIPGGNGRRLCRPRLAAGEDCTTEPAHCATGLVCGPRAIWSSPASDGGDGGVPEGGAEDAGARKYTDRQYCQEDCAHVDPATQTCPFGATSVCDGTRIVGCHCGAPTIASKTCAAGTVCAFAEATGAALCALATDPDPRCVNGGSYCSGMTSVTCQDGFAIQRTNCPIETTCTAFGCSQGQ